MEEHIPIRQEHYEKASHLLGKLFEVDSDITEQINLCIQRYGADNFFNNLEAFGFSSAVFEKLQAVRMVLYGMGEETMKDMQKDSSQIWKHNKPEGGEDV